MGTRHLNNFALGWIRHIEYQSGEGHSDMVTWSMAKQHATGHFDCVGILVRVRAVPMLLRSRGRDGLSPAPVLAVVRLVAAVVLPVLVPPRVDEAAVVPLAAVALQEVLAGARLVLGVVVLGHPPALAVAAVAVVPEAPAVAPEPPPAAAAATVELAAVVVAAALVPAAVEASPAASAAAPVEPVVVHVPGWGPAHVVRRWAMGRSVRWTMRGRTSVVTTWAWT